MKKCYTTIFVLCLILFFASDAYAKGWDYARINLFSHDYVLTGNGAQDMVNIAEAQYMAWGENSSDPYKLENTYPNAWCAAFIADCAILAKQSEAIPAGSTVTTQLTVDNPKAIEVSSPQMGDIVLFQCNGCGYRGHVGLMINSTTMIDGNASGVTIKKRNALGTAKNFNIRNACENCHNYTSSTARFFRPAYNGASTPEDPSYLDCDEWHNVISSDGEMTVRATPSSSGTDTNRRAYSKNNPHHIIKKVTSNGLEWGYVEGLDGWIALGRNYTRVVAVPGKPNIVISASDDLHPVIIEWNETDNTEAYGVFIFDSNANKLYERRVWNTTYAALLPAGSYLIEIGALNDSNNTWNGSGRQAFSVSSASISGMGTLKGKTVYNDHTYEIYAKSTTWLGAKRLAEQNGGYLVTITSQNEQNAVQSLVTKCGGNVWIGAESFSKNTMTWVTGEAMSYSHWATGEPNNDLGVENCAHMYADGYWNDTKCDYYGADMPYYIVEYNTVSGQEMTSGYDRVLPDGDYMIAAAGTQDKSKYYYLDIEGTAQPASDETNVSLCGPSSGDLPSYEIWTLKYNNGFYTITQKGTNMALDVYGGAATQGSNVQVCSINNSSAQKWAISFNGSNGYRLQAKCSGMSLDINGGEIKNGKNVQQWSDNSSDAQSWLFIPYQPKQTLAEGRYVLLTAMDESKEVDLPGNTGDLSNNTLITIWSDSAPSQFNSFDIKKLDNGYYEIIHNASGKALGVYGGSSDKNANISILTRDGSNSQQWAITKDGYGGGYILRSKTSGYAMDLSNSSTSNGTLICQYPYSGGKNQTWKFVRAEYKINYRAETGVSVPSEQVKYYKTSLSLDSSVPQRDGYAFQGWVVQAGTNTVKYHPGDPYTTDADLTLYAVWKKNVTSITLNKSSITLEKGGTEQLTATVSPSDVDSKSVVWRSGNTDIATVSNTGMVTAKAGGKVEITVSTADGSCIAKCYVTVIAPVRLDVSIEQTTWPVNMTAKHLNMIYKMLTVTATYDNGTSKAVAYQWKNDYYSPYGIVNGTIEKKVGSFTFILTYGDLEAPLTLTLVQPVTGVTLDKVSETIEKGKTLTLTATVAPLDASNKIVSWSSSNEDVATVSSTGTVTAKKTGTARITATTEDGGFTSTCSVTVVSSITGVRLNKSRLTLEKGQSETLVPTISPLDASNTTLKWNSSDPDIATVNDAGTVYAKADGVATITVTASDGIHTATCTVTVKTAVKGIALDQTNVEIEEGESLTISAIISPSDASNQDVVWRSSDDSIIKLSTVFIAADSDTTQATTSAAFKAVKKGNAKITVTTVDGAFSASCSVEVKPTEKTKTELITDEVLTLELSEEETITVAGCKKNVKKIAIPKEIEGYSVTDIGESAFEGCTNLTEITIPASVTSIADDAFPVSLKTINVKCGSYADIWAKDNGYTVVRSDHMKIVVDPSKEATETETGLTEGKHCEACGDVIVKQEIVPVKSDEDPTQLTDPTKIKGRRTPMAYELKVTKSETRTGVIVGDKITLIPVKSDGNKLKVKFYKSSSKKIATVSKKGKITVLREGTVTITITPKKGKKIKLMLVITDPNAPETVRFAEGDTITMEVGQKLTLKPHLTPDDALASYAFKSKKTKIATVHETKGTVTAKKKGTTTITVSTHNGKEATITIEVIPKGSLAKNDAKTMLAHEIVENGLTEVLIEPDVYMEFEISTAESAVVEESK